MLDEIDQKICTHICDQRMALIEQGRPLVGDLVLWPNGQKRRISHDWDDSFQTSFLNSGSFFAFMSGDASFSGSLQPAVLAEFLVPTNETKLAGFWFFSHNKAGAGRGVQCELPCSVWVLKPFARNRKEAEAHPKAVQAKEFWGRNKTAYEEVLGEIMNPHVLSKPDYF